MIAWQFGHTGISDPQMYVVPTKIIKAAQDPKDNWHKVSFSKIPKLETYLNNWDIIKKDLGV